MQSVPRVSAVLTNFPLFPVSTPKFIVLSIFSLTLYSFYWFYQNWIRLKAASHESLSPFWRTAFAPLWGLSLFSRIHTLASEHGIAIAWNPAALGTVFLILNLLWWLPDPWGLITFTVFVPLIPVQQTAQSVNEIYAKSVGEARNDTYSVGNVATIIIGGLILAAILTRAFMPGWGPDSIMTVSR
jgi:hypothetical protein